MTVSLKNGQMERRPVLVHALEGMDLLRVVHDVCPPLGNGGSLSLGTTCYVWITHLLSMTNPRLRQIQVGIARCLNQISGIPEKEVSASDFSGNHLCFVPENSRKITPKVY